MLKMSCRLTISSTDRPTILIQPDSAIPHRDHRFYRYTHTSLQHNTITPPAIIGHLWIFMHIPANTMTCQLTHDTISLSLTMILHCTTDITQMMTGNSLLYTKIKRLFCRFQQLLDFFRNLTYTERIRRVSIKAIEECPTVNRDNISFFQNSLRIRHAMNNNIVDRCANAGRERPSIRIREPLKCRNSTMISDEFIGNLIQLEGRYTRLYMFCQFTKRLTNKLVSLAHQLYLIFSLQKYLHRRLVCSHSAAVDSA